MKKDDIIEGVVKEKITYDYILNLYEEMKAQNLSEEETEKRVAVLKVFADHIGEYMVVKYNETTTKGDK